MFISDITGAIRSGTEDANFWSIQDDGLGFPMFFNIETQEKVFDDPRFLSDVGEDVAEQRSFVMQELRYSTYFCKDMLEVYQKAKYEKRQAAMAFQLKLIAKSNKPKLLTAFLIRAKALYTPQSVVDKPCDEGIKNELEYASWLAEEIAALVSMGEETKMAVAKQRVEKLHEVLGATTYYHNTQEEEEEEEEEERGKEKGEGGEGGVDAMSGSVGGGESSSSSTPTLGERRKQKRQVLKGASKKNLT
jgi:hypothetical protein